MSVLGTDIRSDWSFNEQGDLNLISDTDNIAQSIGNRLNTDIGSLPFYREYGVMLYGYMGWRASESTLEFIRLEISNRLKQDPRFKNYNVNCSYIGDGSIRLDLDLVLVSDDDYSTSLVLSKNGEVDIIGN